MKWGRFRLVIAGVILASVGYAADRDLTIEATPVFASTATPQRSKPYRIDIENRGRDTNGVVVINNELFRMEYPIDLPQGAHKSFTAYVTGENFYGQTRASLQTSIGSTYCLITTEGYGQNGVALISDHAGGLSFLRTQDRNNSNEAMRLTDYDVKPVDTPDRTTGYLGMAAVVLGDGAERLSDDQVAAIRRFVLLGGSLIVLGGASSPVLTDPRWSPLLPLADAHPQTVSLAKPVSLMGMTVQGTFTVTNGRSKPEAIVLASLPNGTPFALKRQAGFGRVIVVAANLLEGPALGWSNRGLFLQNMNLGEGSQDLAFVLSGGRQNDPYGGSYSYSGVPPTGSGLANDPFSAKMPDTLSVVLVLGIYFILVVPVNLLVLRKMNKGEWAWITSPIISLVFAGIFFRSAAGLYSATLSTATSGVLVADADVPEAYFAGHAQIFFPRGGQYDLGFKNVDSVSGTQTYYGNNASRVMDKMGPIDTGEIRAPGMQVSNLNFQEFEFQQRFAGGKWFEITRDAAGNYRVTNRSPYNLTHAALVVDGIVLSLADLPQQKTQVTSPKKTSELQGIYASSVIRRCSGGRIAVAGNLQDFKPGPQLGEMVPNYSTMQLVYFANRGTR